MAGGELRGAQIAAGLNLAKRTRGVQIAAGANYATRLDGAQLAPLNIARSGTGTQIGVANVAGEGAGARIGVLNFAARNHGFQVGVVNIAAHDDGESLALLNLIGDGIHEASVYATELMVTNFGLKLGGRHLYTHLIHRLPTGRRPRGRPRALHTLQPALGVRRGSRLALPRRPGPSPLCRGRGGHRCSSERPATCPATLRKWHPCARRSGCGCTAT